MSYTANEFAAFFNWLVPDSGIPARDVTALARRHGFTKRRFTPQDLLRLVRADRARRRT